MEIDQRNVEKFTKHLCWSYVLMFETEIARDHVLIACVMVYFWIWPIFDLNAVQYMLWEFFRTSSRP